METKETQAGCCSPCGGRHKRKIIIIIIAVLLALAVLAIAACAKKVHSERSFAGVGCTAGLDMRNGKTLEKCGPQDVVDPFYPPADAAKKGELTVVAVDASHVTQATADIAAKNGGSVTSTKISYASNGAKQGSIVIQIPADKFESVFNALKTMGAWVVSESTEIIPQNNIVYPMSAAEGQGVKTEIAQPSNAPQDQSAPNSVNASSSAGVAMPAIYPLPPQYAQNKGYIRINFSDDGKSGWSDNRQGSGTIAINSNDFVVIFGHNLLKGSFLILLIAILMWFVKMLKAQKQKMPTRKTTIPAAKKVSVKKAIIKRSRVIRKR